MQLAILRAMRRIVQTIAAIHFAWSTPRDLLLEALALRHQVSVLARSNRRFRSTDRLFWLTLRRVWPRWRDALMLVQLRPSNGSVAAGAFDGGGVVRDALEGHASTPNAAT